MQKTNTKRLRGFTLIELLIVVAIIAILAAIAVPNFLEAQTRAKVARMKADFRTITLGLETYHIDTNKYPHTNYDNRALTDRVNSSGYQLTLERLTTPIAYMTGDATYYDVFKPHYYYWQADLESERVLQQDSHGDDRTNQAIWYTARTPTSMVTWNAAKDPSWWFLESSGPDRHFHLTNNMIGTLTADTPANQGKVGKMFYDPTNGTMSRGSIWRAGGISPSWGASFYKMIQSSGG